MCFKVPSLWPLLITSLMVHFTKYSLGWSLFERTWYIFQAYINFKRSLVFMTRAGGRWHLIFGHRPPLRSPRLRCARRHTNAIGRQCPNPAVLTFFPRLLAYAGSLARHGGAPSRNIVSSRPAAGLDVHRFSLLVRKEETPG